MKSDTKKEHSYSPAPIGLRVSAVVIDSVFVAGIAWFTFSTVSDQSPTWHWVLISLVLFITYHTFSVWLTQQTLGKALMGLRVIRLGKDPGLIWSLGRSSLGYLIVDVFGLGFFVSFFNPGRQSLHDYVFGSAVVIEVQERPNRLNLVARLTHYAETFIDAGEEKTKTRSAFLISDFWGIFEGLGSAIHALVGPSKSVHFVAASGKVFASAAATGVVSTAAIATAVTTTPIQEWLINPRWCSPDCPEVGIEAVSNAFETDTEGWSVSGDGSQPIHTSDGISATDGRTGETWYWQAPGTYLGDKSDYYGKSLRFQLKVVSTGPRRSIDTKDDVFLRSRDITLVTDINGDPGADWEPYCVPISVDGSIPWRDKKTDLDATDVQLQEVLKDLIEVRIRGEYRITTGTEEGKLRDVVFGDPSSC